MTLIRARSLDELLDEDEEFGASGLRESRRAYRQARRRNRQVAKRHELEDKTRDLNRDTRKIRHGAKERDGRLQTARAQNEPPAGSAEPRRLERSRGFPGSGPPARGGPQGRGGPLPTPNGPPPRWREQPQEQDPWRAPTPPEEEPPAPDDWSEPEGFEEEVYPEDQELEPPEEGMAGRPRRPRWGAPIDVSPRVRVQAKGGHRAAVMELQPGLYLVSEFPEESEFGVLPVIATLMARSAARALTESPTDPQRRPLLDLLRREPHAQPAPATALVPVQAPLPALGTPAPNVGWIHPDDAADLFGCPTCRRRR